MDLSKNERIAKARLQTISRHKAMVCKTYKLKVDKSHLSKKTINTMQLLFLEAKWFYNSVLAQMKAGKEISELDYKQKAVLVKNKEGKFEVRCIKYLSSQMRQEIIDRARDNIRGLSALKKNGHKVGQLKFVSKVRSIPLKQYGLTYTIDGNRVRMQNVEQSFRVRGADQIPKDAEITSATFIQLNGDYHIHVTTYQPEAMVNPARRSVGIDSGVKNQLTFSNGIAVTVNVPLTRRLRKLHRELSGRKRGGKNWLRAKVAFNREHGKICNIRLDARRKIVSHLTSRYDCVATQNDNIAAWHRLWGRRIACTGIGRI